MIGERGCPDSGDQGAWLQRISAITVGSPPPFSTDIGNLHCTYRRISGHHRQSKITTSGKKYEVLPHWREGRRKGSPRCHRAHRNTCKVTHSRDDQQVSQSIRRACVVVVAVGITFAVSSESQIDKRQNTTLAALTLRRSIN